MKSFLQYLYLQELRSPPQTEVDDETRIKDAKFGQAAFAGKANYDVHNPNWITDWAIGSSFVPPPDKIRFGPEGEAVFGSDLGLAFRYNPDSGQVEADPAGFKAVRARHAKGQKFTTRFPVVTPAEYRDELIGRLNPFQ